MQTAVQWDGRGQCSFRGGKTKVRSSGAFIPETTSVAFALQTLAQKFAVPANRLCLFACPLLGRLLIVPAEFHLPENAFALHLLFQRSEGLIDIIFANEDLHGLF